MQHIPALNPAQTAQYLSLHHPFPLKLTHSCFSPHAHNFKLYGLDRQRKENIGAGSHGREERRPGRTEKMWSALGLAKTGGCVALLHLWPALDCIRVTDWPWNELRLIRYDRDALGCSGSYYVIRACVDTGFCWLCLVQGQIEKKWMDSTLVQLLDFTLYCGVAILSNRYNLYGGHLFVSPCRTYRAVCWVAASKTHLQAHRPPSAAYWPQGDCIPCIYCVMFRFSITHAARFPVGT